MPKKTAMIAFKKKKLKGFIVSREKVILELCKSKTVLHLGCADYPFSAERHITGTLLHKKLCEAAKTVLGVDCNAKGIDFLRSLGYENLLVGDVENLDVLHLTEKYDVIVAGELLEHLSNVGKFFENIHGVMNKNSILIITVPNGHSIKGFARSLWGNELVHPEHVCYFTPATIDHLCERYGYQVLEHFYYLAEIRGTVKRLMFLPIKYFMEFVSPHVADGLIFIIKRD